MCWKMRPNPTQPNPWMDPTHVHLWAWPSHCLYVRKHSSETTRPVHQNTLCCYLWRFLGFVDDVMFAHYSQEYATRERHILKLTHQGASPERGRSLLCAIALLQTASCAVTAVGLRRTTKNKTFGDNSYVSSSPSPSSVNIKGNIRGISLSLVHRNAIVFTTSLLISNLRGT